MKRMVLIPEEKLLHYEQREREGGKQEGEGRPRWEKFARDFHETEMKGKGGNQSGKGFLEDADNFGNWLECQVQKDEGSGLGEFAASAYRDMGGKGENELTDDVIVRGIPKTMKTRATALLE